MEVLVADLMARVDELEEGGGAGSNTFEVIHLEPLATCPSDPSEGDLCLISAYGRNWFCGYLDGKWYRIDNRGGPPPHGEFTCPE